MKRIYYFLVFVIFPLLMVFLLFLNIFLPSGRYKGYKTVDYRLEGKKYKFLVADTLQKWERGLMGIKKLDGVQGMIFLFPDKQIRHFWNKNTYLDLDVYWIDNERVVGKDYLPSIAKSKEIIAINSKVKINKVVELIK